jgi:hypothetical protein
MTIKIKYNRSFELEDVVPGDLLIDRQDNVIVYCVLSENILSEEWICVRVGEEGPLKNLLIRIGFEAIEDYIKVDLNE